MSNGIYSALSGAIAQQRSLDVVANNVANANTTGYRADRVAFRSAMARARGGAPAPGAPRYVAVSRVATDPRPGTLRETGNPLDVALEGPGWLSVRTPGGERYTRAGAFTTDGDGVLRTPAGHAVLGVPEDPRRPPAQIVIPAGTADIQIASDGTVAADGVRIGRLRIVELRGGAPAKEGATLFTAGGATVVQSDVARVSQRTLESSNVSAMAGLNELITASRSFDAFQRVIRAFRQIDERTARELGARG